MTSATRLPLANLKSKSTPTVRRCLTKTRKVRKMANANVETTTDRDVAEDRTIVEVLAVEVTATPQLTTDVAVTLTLETELLTRKTELWKARSPVNNVNPVHPVNLVNLANPVRTITTWLSKLPMTPTVTSKSAPSTEDTEVSAVVVKAK